MAESLKDAVRADAFRKLEVQDELADPFATPERTRQHADSFFSDEDEGPNALDRPERNFLPGRTLPKMERNLDGDFVLMSEGRAMKHVSESVLDDQQESAAAERNRDPPAPAPAESKEDPPAPAPAKSKEDPPAPAPAESKEDPPAPAPAESKEHPPAPAAAERKEDPPAPVAAERKTDLPAPGPSTEIAAAAPAVPDLLSLPSNEFMASDDDRDPGADSDALKRPAACIPKAKPKAKGPRPLKRPAACVSTSPDDEADAVLKKPAAGPHVAAAAPAASPLPGCGGVTDTWEWVAVEGQQHLRECVIGDWKAMQDQTILS